MSFRGSHLGGKCVHFVNIYQAAHIAFMRFIIKVKRREAEKQQSGLQGCREK